MTKKQTSYLYSAKNVFSVLTANASIYAVISILVALRDRIQGKLDLIETISQEQERKRKGIGADKTRIRDLVTRSLLTVCGQVRSWAGETNQNDVAEQVPATKSAWNRVPHLKLGERAKAVLQLARKHRDELTGYGMTDELLQQLERGIAAYEAIVIAPRNAITRRKTLTSLLDQELVSLQEQMDNVLDPLMNQFEDTAPGFFQDYKNARRLVQPARTPIEVIRERSAIKAKALADRKKARVDKATAKETQKAETKARRQARFEELGIASPASRESASQSIAGTTESSSPGLVS
jgi:hypothetical protein